MRKCKQIRLMKKEGWTLAFTYPHRGGIVMVYQMGSDVCEVTARIGRIEKLVYHKKDGTPQYYHDFKEKKEWVSEEVKEKYEKCTKQ